VEPAVVLAMTVCLSCGLVLVTDMVMHVVASIATGSLALPVGARRIIVGLFILGVVASARPVPAAATVPPPAVRISDGGGSRSSWPVAPVVSSLLPSGRDTQYTVQPGDCLWRIARRHLQAGGRGVSGTSITRFWTAIYDRNRDVIGKDPNLIRPGQVLSIPEV